MKILCISDLLEGSNHSSVNGIFSSNLFNTASCDVVFFSKTKTLSRSENKIVIPYSNKRKNLVSSLESQLQLDDYDFVIVRNYFPVLRQVLKSRQKYKFKIGFWESFPHSYRRLHQAFQLNKSVLRKKVEYYVKNKNENSLLSKVDFYLPITEKFQEVFRPNLDCPTMALPIGVNFQRIPPPPSNSPEKQILKFIYIGTVDQLRKLDTIVNAISSVKGDYVLDIYTASDNEQTSSIASLKDKRITVKQALPREELMRKMMEYDVGIGLIPENKLYIVSSPTKTLEYYAVGIPSIINSMPDYKGILTDDDAFYCTFEESDITKLIERILLMPKNKLKQMGLSGKGKVLQKRDYRILSNSLKAFLQNTFKASG